MIRVTLVGGSLRGRRGLEARLRLGEGASVEGFATLEEAAEVMEERAPDVLLLEETQPGTQVNEWLSLLQENGLAREFPVVLLLIQPSAEEVGRVMRSGIRGVLPANADGRQLTAAVEAAAAGLIVLPGNEVPVQVAARDSQNGDDDALVEPLTPREKDVLRLLASGLANKEIAARLGISDHTVKYHVASILGKLGAASRTEAVSIGMRRGLILL